MSWSFRLSSFSMRVQLGMVRGQPDQCEIVKCSQVSGSKKKKRKKKKSIYYEQTLKLFWLSSFLQKGSLEVFFVRKPLIAWLFSACFCDLTRECLWASKVPFLSSNSAQLFLRYYALKLPFPFSLLCASRKYLPPARRVISMTILRETGDATKAEAKGRCVELQHSGNKRWEGQGTCVAIPAPAYLAFGLSCTNEGIHHCAAVFPMS